MRLIFSDGKVFLFNDGERIEFNNLLDALIFGMENKNGKEK